MTPITSGIIVIDKETGYTSHDVVAKLRRILGTRRVGHTGTLDPEAAGVLPVAFGQATRLTDLIADHSKTYEAVLRLGVETDTQDMTGRILTESGFLPDERAVCEAAGSFVGEQLQIPPMYSAKKVGGKKLYELARAGETVERKPNRIRIDSIEITKICFPLVFFTVDCSKGTYIRTLCHDIGQKLGCGGAMQALRRTRVGAFSIRQSVSIEKVEEAVKEGRLGDLVITVEEVLSQYPRVRCRVDEDRLLINGNPLKEVFADMQDPCLRPDEILLSGKVRMCTSDGTFIGLYEWNADRKKYMPVKMLG